jgi:hypothetical protein
VALHSSGIPGLVDQYRKKVSQSGYQYYCHATGISLLSGTVTFEVLEKSLSKIVDAGPPFPKNKKHGECVFIG